jgi:hypothetical protein
MILSIDILDIDFFHLTIAPVRGDHAAGSRPPDQRGQSKR